MTKQQVFTDKYIILNAACVPVKGAKRAVICDLYRQDFDFIPNLVCDFIIKYDRMQISEIIEEGEFSLTDVQDIVSFFKEREYIYLGKKEDLTRFPKMNLLPQLQTNLIDDAIVFRTEEKKYQFNHLIKILNELGCKALQIIFTGNISNDEILADLSNIQESRIELVNLVIANNKIIDKEFFLNIEQFHNRIFEVLIFGNKIEFESTQFELKYSNKDFSSSKICGFVSPNFFTINKEFYITSKFYNNCLHKKIVINSNGDIKNCPMQERNFGNINQHESLLNIVEATPYKKIGRITKDEVSTCKDCEFRYICSDCRYKVVNGIYSKPITCKYNPYTNEWN